MIMRIVRRIKKELIQYAYLFGKSPLNQNCADKIIESTHGKTKIDATIAPVYNNKKGILTIISDDGLFSTAKTLDILSREYAIPITIAGTVQNIGWHVKWWRKTLKKNRNIELVNHSYNHIRMEEGSKISIDNKRLTHELVHSKIFFEKHFGKKQITFVCPENQMCSMGYRMLREQDILAVRQGIRGLNDIFPEDGMNPGEYYNLKCIGIMDDSGIHAEKTREKWIKAAIEKRKWLIEMWHNVQDDSLEGYQTILTKDAKIHLESIRKHIDYEELWVAKFTDVIKYFYERDHSQIYANYDAHGIQVSLKMEKVFQSKGCFDFPLTICLSIPDEFLNRLNGNELDIDSFGKLYVELKPGESKEILFS